LAVELWARIISTFGLSIAKEWLITIKALLDINPQGNYLVIIHDFQQIIAKLRRINLLFKDIIYNIF
jgi:hypothetical protein